MTRPPNVILITSDQHRSDCLGILGRGAKTPHLDRLAQAGTHFEACITPNPVCQPARASILTGLLPLNHGVYDNGVDLNERVGELGFAGRFGDAGYSTALIGKGHFSTYVTREPTGRPECLQSTNEFGPDWFGPYMGFDHVELAIRPHWIQAPQRPPYGQHFERWYYSQGNPDELAKLVHKSLPPVLDVAQTFHSALPPAWHCSTWTADRAIAFLERNKAEPFCMWVSFGDPHHPFDAPEPWSRMHDPNDMQLPENSILDLDRRPWWHRLAVEGEIADSNSEIREWREKHSRMPTPSETGLRQMMANYLGMIALIDHNIGRIVAAINANGLADDSIIVYTSDHGEWLGDHGLVQKGPMLYRGLLEVPLIVYVPRLKDRVFRVADPVSTLDLAETLYELTGIGSDEESDGRSLLPLMQANNQRLSREYALNEWNFHKQRLGTELRLRTVRSHRFRMTIERNSGTGELYDLAKDPGETTNQFANPKYANTRDQHERWLESRGPEPSTELVEPVGMA